MRADRAGGFKGGLTDKERGLGQRAIGVTNHVIGQKERTFRVARLIFWVHIRRAVGLLAYTTIRFN